MSEPFLFDTDVLSRLRRPEREPRLRAWYEATPDAHMHLTSITLMEIERGIAAQRGRDPVFAGHLATWRDWLVEGYGGRILPFDEAAALQTGRLIHRLGHLSPDLQIAGIALARDMAVATLNTRHYAPTGCRLIEI